MRFASLGSGSKGNATLVEDSGCCVLVDCGFSIADTCRRLARLERRPEALQGILVTHEHSDHLRGVLPLARRFGLPVYMTAGTARSTELRSEDRVLLIEPDRAFQLGALRVTPVPVPHDAREPVQYVFESGGIRLGILTDLGKITSHVVAQFRTCHGLLLEANHDTDLLEAGPYPPSLKRRVSGDWGHLSNHQCADMLARLDRKGLQCLVLGHISQQNNSRTSLLATVGHLVEDLANVIYAGQDEGFDWQYLG